MATQQVKLRQKAERARCLEAILASTAKKKIIVAGPGTGKTFTFGKVFESRAGGNNLAMTFIRKLVGEMERSLGSNAEVKTFHAYCKKILHAQNGKVEIAPFLTHLIGRDAELLGMELSGFDAKFQTLEENAPEVAFHLKRGDYYEAVGFDDSVFRLYKALQNDPDVLPPFDQIVIDEFQDFHQLEVAFIDELSKKGDILIVGDDDQAIYDGRNASPNHLRERHRSTDFAKFHLPFCSRCPEVIVTATNCLIRRAQEEGHLIDRIAKPYECYFEDKEADSAKYSKIVYATCTTAPVLATYVQHEISKIDPQDIAESHLQGKEYPTVLIIGTKQYLQVVSKSLKKAGMAFTYTPGQEIGYGLIDAYEWLLRDPNANLGWRILVELFCDEEQQKRIVKASDNGVAIVTLLDPHLVANHLRGVELVRAIRTEEQQLSAVMDELKQILGTNYDHVALHFSPKQDEEPEAIDTTKPTILLTSFMGCKGLSAGHVFVVGVHNGSIPRHPDAITDVEVSQLIVALTRTRKQCRIVSNDWLVAPVDKDQKPIPKFHKSTLVSWIPSDLVENRGKLTAKSVKS
jgi:superfamily I DNA/RNA helicase